MQREQREQREQRKILYEDSLLEGAVPLDVSTHADAPLTAPASAQSYALMCMVPKRSLLKTVIPGWLWSGMTPEGGKQNIPICATNINSNGQNYIG